MEKKKLLEMYRMMLLIRRFEERTAQMYGMQKIGGFCHLYIGQEAVGVGAVSALRPGDQFISAYRDHGHILAMGGEPNAVMAELFGKATGVSRGKGGSMHLFDVEKGYYGGHGIVAGQVPVATGMAFAAKYRKEDKVILCSMGEGTVHQGAFHESLNLAKLWRLPVIYMIENNRYGMGTPLERASAVWDLSEKACSYDMARATVDGMDVLAVHDVVAEAIVRATRDGEPTLIEARTYRFRGHSMSDPVHSHYRTKEEVEEQKRQDPILIFQQKLIDDKILTPEKVKEYEDEIKKIVLDAVDFAEKSPLPALEELYTEIYS
ncbi:MAG TPA: pyruvate dehydrogenase (acetyl-transferring) E1 component subunit alpha [bacterium]|nr:pyruvate dehydrogenase (acetyl-transferring) E1 component subunit alpha [bacterium]HOH06482.1 pyruvate dehydrogenase (acetyl-transferring) E1 component subunit alpha [bacterium]HOY45543.1 pyruvate dehydrogenase (acetyl-transferring) E1 component subunit alpha [bacterium]HPM59511.1 pyruvate dehydrogenase (acetyl-transferring) E1 component subunit alpha [bacterium]